jgi:hypothetical protein
VKEGGNTLHKTERGKTNWLGHILRRNSFLKHVIEGNKEGREGETDDVSSYWTTLRNGEDNGI